MNKKIQELTEKILKEGVEKGEKRAQEVITEAESRTQSMISDARAQAEKIVSQARKEAEELQRNVESEIKLSGRQALSAVKQQIMDVITAETVDKKITSALKEVDVLKDLVKTVVQNWKADSAEAPALEILLPLEKQKELENYFKSQAGKAMSKSLKVSFSKNIRGGFQIGPQDNSFRISLTDEDFTEFFRQYLRPKTRKFLFSD
jgi:V/A-type H+-transporting ATPase subunit E